MSRHQSQNVSAQPPTFGCPLHDDTCRVNVAYTPFHLVAYRTYHTKPTVCGFCTAVSPSLNPDGEKLGSARRRSQGPRGAAEAVHPSSEENTQGALHAEAAPPRSDPDGGEGELETATGLARRDPCKKPCIHHPWWTAHEPGCVSDHSSTRREHKTWENMIRELHGIEHHAHPTRGAGGSSFPVALCH